jgi:hypothetical protein
MPPWFVIPRSGPQWYAQGCGGYNTCCWTRAPRLHLCLRRVARWARGQEQMRALADACSPPGLVPVGRFAPAREDQRGVDEGDVTRPPQGRRLGSPALPGWPRLHARLRAAHVPGTDS